MIIRLNTQLVDNTYWGRRGCSRGSLQASQKSYFCKVQLEPQIWDLEWCEVHVWGSGHPDGCHFLTHLRLCVCMQLYLPDLSGLEVVCMISHFPSSQYPHRQTFIPQHSHNVMGKQLSARKLCFIWMMTSHISVVLFSWTVLVSCRTPVNLVFVYLPASIFHVLHTKTSPVMSPSVRYLAKLSSVGSIRDEETCERLRGLIQRQVHRRSTTAMTWSLCTQLCTCLVHDDCIV